MEDSLEKLLMELMESWEERYLTNIINDIHEQIEKDSIFTCLNIESYFLRIDNEKVKTELSKFYFIFSKLLNDVQSLKGLRWEIMNFNGDAYFLNKFDYDSMMTGNGLRTMINYEGILLIEIEKRLKQIQDKLLNTSFISSFIPRFSSVTTMELFDWCDALGAMRHMMQTIILLLKMFEPEDKDWSKVIIFDTKKLVESSIADRLDASKFNCFFGNCIAFPFPPSIKRLLYVLSLILATYAASSNYTLMIDNKEYNQENGTSSSSTTSSTSSPSTMNYLFDYVTWSAKSALNAANYSVSPSARSHKILMTLENCDVKFIERFWSLSESASLASFGQALLLPKFLKNELIQIKFDTMDIELSKENIYRLSTEMKSDHHFNIRHINYSKTECDKNGQFDTIIIHAHGGGFVAHSSRSHFVYLQSWAKSLKLPIFSIDYTLATEEPHPMAIDECFYSLLWLQQNKQLINWNGKRIICVGDSAGGYLLTAASLQIGHLLKYENFVQNSSTNFQLKKLTNWNEETIVKVKKVDGLVTCYAPFILHFTISPSRLLTAIESLVPYQMLWKCLGTYCGIGIDRQMMENGRKESVLHFFHRNLDKYSNDPLLSLVEADDNVLKCLPKMVMFACDNDPLLDDSVMMAKRLRDSSMDGHLIILGDVCHAFLNFYVISKECENAMKKVENWLRLLSFDENELAQ
ncbi:hypothetical protein SNEBB_003693 [Seison nebaliae]|nr:hypothetical protein SNEBB_003693 [Seison nebaliae]